MYNEYRPYNHNTSQEIKHSQHLKIPFCPVRSKEQLNWKLENIESTTNQNLQDVVK